MKESICKYYQQDNGLHSCISHRRKLKCTPNEKEKKLLSSFTIEVLKESKLESASCSVYYVTHDCSVHDYAELCIDTEYFKLDYIKAILTLAKAANNLSNKKMNNNIKTVCLANVLGTSYTLLPESIKALKKEISKISPSTTNNWR